MSISLRKERLGRLAHRTSRRRGRPERLKCSMESSQSERDEKTKGTTTAPRRPGWLHGRESPEGGKAIPWKTGVAPGVRSAEI